MKVSLFYQLPSLSFARTNVYFVLSFLQHRLNSVCWPIKSGRRNPCFYTLPVQSPHFCTCYAYRTLVVVASLFLSKSSLSVSHSNHSMENRHRLVFSFKTFPYELYSVSENSYKCWLVWDSQLLLVAWFTDVLVTVIHYVSSEIGSIESLAKSRREYLPFQ